METTLTCAVCGMELKANWRKCPKCKTPAGSSKAPEPEAVKTVKCICGAELEADWLTCPECGTDVEREAPPSSGNAGTHTDGAKTVEEYQKCADEYLGKSGIEDAIKELSEGLNRYPGNTKLLNDRAVFLHFSGETESAIKDWSEIIKLEPENAAVYNNRGDSYNETEEYDKALADANEAIRLNPDDANFYNTRATALKGKGDFDAAMKDYNKAVQMDPDDDDFYKNRGDLYSEKEDYDHAIADYTKGLKINPDSDVLYYERGEAYSNQGDYTTAIADYTKAIQIDPEYTAAFCGRGIAYYKNDDNGKAIKDLTKAIQLDSVNPNASDWLIVSIIKKHIKPLLEKNKSLYLYPDIPDNILKNTIESYVPVDPDEVIILIQDHTLLWSKNPGKEGLCLSTKAIYWNNNIDTWYIDFADIQTLDLRGEDLSINGGKFKIGLAARILKPIKDILDEILVHIRG